jgi:glutamyl-tRNA synthetase
MRGRFAPSPSGPLHYGNLRTGLLAWLCARVQQSTFVLRNEDLDRPRARPEAAVAIIQDLRWLGLDWDEGPDVGGPFGPYNQSERLHLYTRHLEALQESGHVYPCYCSRADITRAASAPHAGEMEAGRYNGACRDERFRQAQQQAHPERRPAYRFRMQPRTITLLDAVYGTASFRLEEGRDDFVLWRSDGTPAYQLAVVVDDALMQVEEVVRGADLLACTPWQIALFEALGYPPPRYAHVPLMRDGSGNRLAKRDHSAGIHTSRQGGMTSQQMVGYLAASCGLLDEARPCLPHDLLSGFSLERIARHASAAPADQAVL